MRHSGRLLFALVPVLTFAFLEFPVNDVIKSILSGLRGVVAEVDAVVAEIGVSGVFVGDKFWTEPGLSGHSKRPLGLF